jgi:hypothetical protein
MSLSVLAQSHMSLTSGKTSSPFIRMCVCLSMGCILLITFRQQPQQRVGGLRGEADNRRGAVQKADDEAHGAGQERRRPEVVVRHRAWPQRPEVRVVAPGFEDRQTGIVGKAGRQTHSRPARRPVSLMDGRTDSDSQTSGQTNRQLFEGIGGSAKSKPPPKLQRFG